MAKRMGDTNAWVRTFEVSEPTRHRKGFTVYKVTSTVFPRSFPESATKITVWKRYSDFSKLHKDLEATFKQLYLKGEFPPFPKAKVFGRFEHEVVEERRNAALVLLQFTANYTLLFTNKSFIQFFENGYSTQDFLGKILFSRQGGTGTEEPPTPVVQEKSEIDAPCLEPEKVWTSSLSRGDDCVSLSPSVSSSLSPETSEMVPVSNLDRKPSSSTLSSDLVYVNVTPGAPTSTAAAESFYSNQNTECASSRDPIQASYGNVTVTTFNDQSSQIISPTTLPSPPPLKPTLPHRGNGIVRSATVTDDLSSYFDDEFEDSAFVFPMGSCSSLDTLPGFTSAQEQEANEKASTSSSHRGLFSLPRRRPNGFGLFDFLPLFPKKSKNKVPDKKDVEKEKATSLSVGYICEAAGHFAVAQFHESNMDYEDAFKAYKEGIRVLLAGAQDDSDLERKLLAKNKLEKYLSRAEGLKDMHLAPGNTNGGSRALSPVFSSPNRKEKCLSGLNPALNNASQLRGKMSPSSLEELKQYKIVGLGPGGIKILIVMNPDDRSPKCFAAKVLWKSPCVIYPDKPSIVPMNVPFMVKLQKWFDTPDKVVLLLEHAGGGRLINFVRKYQCKRLSINMQEDITPEDDQANEFVDIEAEIQRISRNALRPDLNDAGLEEPVLNDMANSPSQLTEDVLSVVIDESEEDPRIENLNSNSHETSEQFSAAQEDEDKPEIENELSSPELVEVRNLLANSKALLQTVSKTLEEGRVREIKAPSNAAIINSPPCSQGPNQEISRPTHTDTIFKNETPEQPSTESNEICDNDVSDKQYIKSDLDDDIDDSRTPKRLVPEGCIKVWAAEIVLALEALHECGITYGDLHMNHILLGENGHILLCYKSLWNQVDDPVSWTRYMAPEVRDSIGVPLWKIHPSADWWSLGAILYVLLTGQSFHAAHPEGIFSEMVIKVPETTVNGSLISRSAQTLLSELLQYAPSIRLGYYGAAEIKSHPFFEGFDWNKATDEEATLDV